MPDYNKMMKNRAASMVKELNAQAKDARANGNTDLAKDLKSRAAAVRKNAARIYG